MTIDGWLKLRSNFLGVTAHCYMPDANELYTLILGLIPFEEQHTAQNIDKIMKNILNDLGQDIGGELSLKISGVTTDGASNMRLWGKVLTSIQFWSYCFAHRYHLFVSDGLLPANVSASAKKLLCKVTFLLGKFRNVAAFYNTLNVFQADRIKNLGLTIASLEEAIEKATVGEEKAKLIVEHARAVAVMNGPLGRVLSIICPFEIRWNVHDMAIERILLIKRDFSLAMSACVEKKLIQPANALSEEDWADVKSMHKLFEKFSAISAAVQASNSVTISLIAPAIERTRLYINEKSTDSPVITSIKSTLRNQFKIRFEDVYCHDDSTKKAYFVAALLDPDYRKFNFTLNFQGLDRKAELIAAVTAFLVGERLDSFNKARAERRKK